MSRFSIVMVRTHFPRRSASSTYRRAAGSALVIAATASSSSARALDVQPNDDGASLATSVLVNPQLTLVSASYSGASGAAATFSSGPMGSGAGAVLTTGMASGVLPPNDSGATSTDHGQSGAGICDSLIAGASFDPVKLHFQVTFPNTFDSLRIPVVFASEEYPESSSRNPSDAGAIYVNGNLVGQFDAATLAQAGVYGAATESELDAAAAFVIDAPTIPGLNTVDIVLCDGGDGSFDSALFVSAIQPCYDGICGTLGPCGIVDLDGDGESACTDCDDLDASVNALGIDVCNGKDDDCDGSVDTGFGVGTGCSAGIGACYRTGHMACDAFGGVVCDAVPFAPETEQCGDAIDSDCDGFVDPASGCAGGGGGANAGGGSGASGGASAGGAPASGGAEAGGESAGGQGSAAGGETSAGGAAASGGSSSASGGSPSASGGASASTGGAAHGGNASGGSDAGGSDSGGSDSGGSGQAGSDGLDGTSVLDPAFTGGGCSCDIGGSETTRTSVGAVAVLALALLKRRRQKA